MTSQRVARRWSYPQIGVLAAALLLIAGGAGCARPGSASANPTPTHIPQPTPDPTMVEVIRGNASPVVYLPPLEIGGSPTAVPTTRPPAAPANRAAPKPAAPARGAAPTPAPAPKPANPVPRPAPTAVKPANSGSGAPGTAPAVINPNTVLPSGPGRPNPTPAR